MNRQAADVNGFPISGTPSPRLEEILVGVRHHAECIARFFHGEHTLSPGKRTTALRDGPMDAG